MTNKTKLTWDNPTLNTDGTAYDQATQGAGYELAFDASDEAQVVLPFALGTTFDMAALAAYDALKSGTHTAKLRVVTKEGEKSAYAAATFQKSGTPVAPKNLAVG